MIPTELYHHSDSLTGYKKDEEDGDDSIAERDQGSSKYYKHRRQPLAPDERKLKSIENKKRKYSSDSAVSNKQPNSSNKSNTHDRDSNKKNKTNHNLTNNKTVSHGHFANQKKQPAKPFPNPSNAKPISHNKSLPSITKPDSAEKKDETENAIKENVTSDDKEKKEKKKKDKKEKKEKKDKPTED